MEMKMKSHAGETSKERRENSLAPTVQGRNGKKKNQALSV